MTSEKPVGRCALWIAAAASLILLTATPAEAYIGPGAGFALLTSFLTLLTTASIAILTFLIWPFRKVWQMLTRPRRARSFVRRLVVVGLDGLGPELTERFMSEGKLPNFRKLAEGGSYRRIRTASSVSAAPWSVFSSGTSLNVHKPFWSVLGRHGVWSTVLRVPITSPPDRFHGAQLSAMSVPDLRGSQGTFTLLTTRPLTDGQKGGGLRLSIAVHGDRVESALPGPASSSAGALHALHVPLRMELNRAKGEATVVFGTTRVTLRPGRQSEWLTVTFHAGLWSKVAGICRLLLLEMGEHVSLYVTPINIDPEKPAMPISHPRFYASYLAKRVGKFATLGLAEDSRAAKEGVLGSSDFQAQVYDIDRERESMFSVALDRLRAGVLVCVFDGTDRIQQVCQRDEAAIEKVYLHNDALVGRMMGSLRQDDLLLVLSRDVLFSNRKVDVAEPALVDVAPTILRAFGIAPPSEMEGAPLFDFSPAPAHAQEGGAAQ